MLTGYIAQEGLKEALASSLKGEVERLGNLFLVKGAPQKAYFAQNIWYDVKEINIASISDAASQLKSLGKLWALYPTNCIRRSSLIQERLSFFKPKPLDFPAHLPIAPLGSWTMASESKIYASASCSSPFAHGEVLFKESKLPPSRAYLKLWEALLLSGSMPEVKDKCLEIGASPGSWTWVLQSLGCNVTAVDKAPLDETVLDLPGVSFLKKDAFALKPEDFPEIKWFFSDVICYPEKLLQMIHRWKEVHPELNFICTIKFQGTANYNIVDEFAKIPNSKIVHLSHNKHELTWSLIHKKEGV